MKCGISSRIMMVLVASVMLTGMLFAVLMLSASISVIGFKISAALGYGVGVFLLWFLLDALGRFCGERFIKHEPWIVMVVFFLMYLGILQIVPDLGQIRMPYDSLRAQKSLEAGHIAFFRPLKFIYWINYDFVLSVLGMVFSPKLVVGQILNAICRALALYPVFMLCERVAGRRMARFVTIMLGLSPTLTLYATTLVGDYLSALFYLYAVYLFLSVPNWDQLSLDKVYLWILVGFFAGLGNLFKSISYLYFAAFVVWITIKGLDRQSVRKALLPCLALLIIVLSHGMVMTARSAIIHGMCSDPKAQKVDGEGVVAGFLYELYLGMYIPSMGGYSPVRDRAFRAAPMENKIEMVKDMFVKDAKRYPKFVVEKFRMLWGSNDSPGSILDWFRMSCQNDCYNLKDKNHCVPWLLPLLRAEHLFFTLFFSLGAGGLLLSIGKSLDFIKSGIVSLVIVLLFVALSVLIESHGRYKTAVYPYFFMVMPYASVWFKKENPLYVRIIAYIRKWFCVSASARQPLS